MFKQTKKSYYAAGAIITLGLMSGAQDAHAAGAGAGGGNNFNTIASNITTSISDLPGLLSALSYLFGILLGVLGVMKIKDHVENPSNTPLKDGAIRLAAGGALFALPMIYEAMFETIGDSTTGAGPAELNKVTFGVAD